MSSSSWTTRSPSTASATTSTGPRGPGRSTSTQPPATRPSDTGRVRVSATGLLRVGGGAFAGAVRAEAEQAEDGDGRGRADDPDVGDVAHEPVAVGDEVDDVATGEAGLAQQPVGEVAE